MINASQRILSRSRVEKDPVTPEILQALVISNIKDKFPSLSDSDRSLYTQLATRGFSVLVNYAI